MTLVPGRNPASRRWPDWPRSEAVATHERRIVSADAELIRRVQAALGTEEEGEALVEVARNAHRAELELAARIRRQDHNREREIFEGYEDD